MSIDAFNHFSKYIPMDRRQAMAAGETLPDRVSGTALFADISGFTPLTNALVKAFGRRRGAEEVLRYINPIYEALIACLYEYRGSVISFAGDAITCWLDGDDGLRGVACALAMQAVMQQFDVIIMPDGTEIKLAIKIALANGAARRFLAGDAHHQLFDALAGDTLARMAAAEHETASGEVVVSHEIATRLGDVLQVVAWRKGVFAVVDGLATTVATDSWPTVTEDTFAERVLKAWVNPVNYGRSRASTTFLAELRPTTALFLSFAGLDYDGDDGAGDKLNAYVQWVQGVLARYGGHVLQLTIGDKGSYIYASFGTFVIHDDDPARAVAAALDLQQQVPAELAYVTAVRIGISQGLVWTGEIGALQRGTYGAMGEQVNMSARLMSHAKPGQILVHERVANLTEGQYEFLPLGQIQVKGRTKALPVSVALRRRVPRASWLSTLFDAPLVGRERVLKSLHQHLKIAGQGQGQIVQIEGAAGAGKSHLTAVFLEQVAEKGWQVVMGACRGINQATPYTPWQQVVSSLLGIHAYPMAQWGAHLANLLPVMNPDWEIRLPVLADLLSVPIEDNPTTANLDSQSRQEALFSLVIELLHYQARTEPVLLLIEDVHWIDDASAALVAAVGRAMRQMPLLLLLVHRPALSADTPILPMLPHFAYRHQQRLDDLTPEGIEALAQYRLQAPLAPLVAQFIQMRAQGNPFFAEELVDALREANYITLTEAGSWWFSTTAFDAFLAANCLEKVAGQWQFSENPPLNGVDLDMPDSVHGTVLSRLDRLPNKTKLTLKVASVIGRVFSIDLLQAIHPESLTLAMLHEEIEVMSHRDFVRLETISDSPTYIFKHNITQEVAYSALLFAQRRQLHRQVATWYETAVGPTIGEDGLPLESVLAPYYAILYHHWHYAEVDERECFYARLAGEQAAARYMNAQAIRYFTEALRLLAERDEGMRYQLLLAREKVYDLSGLREPQAQDLAALTRLVDVLQDDRRAAEIYLRQANYQLGLSEYAEVIQLAQQALQTASHFGDREQAQLLQAEAYFVLGKALRRQGDYEAAQKQLQQVLALPTNELMRRFEADALLELATINFYVGDYPQAERYVQQSARKYRQLNDRKGETGSLMMMGAIRIHRGHYLVGQERYRQALLTCRTIGYRFGETLILGNMGVGYEYLGDYELARTSQEEALDICREIGDQEGAAYCLTNLTNLYYWLEDYGMAQVFGESGLALIEQMGDKRNEAYVLTYLGRVVSEMAQLPAAQRYYERALALRRELGDEGGVVDALAGLAEVAQKQDDLALALHYVDEVLAWIGANDTNGVEYPLYVYLIAYRVLQAGAESGLVAAKRPFDVLQTAYDLLQTQASRILDVASRHNFLEKVPFNREIAQIWGQQGRN